MILSELDPRERNALQRRTFLYCSGISKPLAAARTATLRLGATRRPGAAAAFAATLEAMVKAIVWVESNAGVALCRRVSGRREGRARGRECRDVRVRNAGRARTEAPSKIGSGAFLLRRINFSQSISIGPRSVTQETRRFVKKTIVYYYA